MASKQWIERKGGKSAQYFFKEFQITKKKELKYLKSLAIPPGWREVKIAVNKKSKVVAIGIDKAGRMQSIYHPTFRARQEQAKFERILRFARALPSMRRVTAEHLRRPNLDRQKVLACIVRLMDQAYFRVGNEVYAKENESYGLTTIRSKHTTVRGNTITFDFMGKSGQQQLKKITDKKLAKIVKKLDDLPGYAVFKYFAEDGDLKVVRSNDVNDYIKEIMGEEFSAKDFRTWGGTLLASAELAQADRSRSLRERKKTVTVCIQNVAKRLGNTPAIARGSYIDPRIIKAFVYHDDLRQVHETVKNIQRAPYLSHDEHCVLHLLEQTKH